MAFQSKILTRFYCIAVLVSSARSVNIRCAPSVTSASRLLEAFYSTCPSQSAVDKVLSRSNGTKHQFFQGMRAMFPLFLGSSDSGLDDSRVRINTTANVCFFGDSISRELSESWRRIAPQSATVLKTEPRQTRSCIHLNTRDSAYGKTYAKVAKNRLGWMKNSNCDAIFVGGFGPHCLLRIPHAEKPGQNASLPLPGTLQAHRSQVIEALRALADHSRAEGAPVIFVGSPVVEAEIMMLPPAKRDSLNFRDFSLEKLWAMGEKEAFQEESTWKEPKDEGSPRSAAPFLRLLYLARFHLACPGWRCDGMHANKPSLEFSCAGQPGFLDLLLAAFVETSGLLSRWYSRGLAPPPAQAVDITSAVAWLCKSER